MCHVHNEKLEKRSSRSNDVPKQERIRTLGEEENYKYLDMLEADTIKQAEMKEKM